MSFLVRGCRARVQFQWTPLISQPTRGVKKGPPKVERDDKGQVRKKKQKEGISVFNPLPPAQLDKPLLQPPEPTLKIPGFDAKHISEKMVGKAVAFQFSEHDPARKFGVPKKLLLEHRVLSKPYTVIRNVTLDVVGKLNNAKNSPSSDSRYVLTGRPGAGKSSVLLQAVEYCSQRKWFIIYIPRGVTLVNSSTPYVYDLRTQTYLQPQFALQTLQRTLSVNNDMLSTLHTTKKSSFEKRELPLGSSLTDLIAIGLKDASSAPAVLDTLMTEMSQQTKYPVLLAIDDFQALYCKTAYKDPFFTTIRPYHLSMPRLMMEFASGKRSFAKGAVLGAVTSSDPAYPLPLELREALQVPYEHPQSPYDKRSTALSGYANGLTSIPVPERLTLDEAASLFEAWKEEHVLAPVRYDELFLSKYTESSGNPREFIRGLLSTLSI